MHSRLHRCAEVQWQLQMEGNGGEPLRSLEAPLWGLWIHQCNRKWDGGTAQPQSHRACLRSTEVHSSSYRKPASALTHCMAYLCRGFSNIVTWHLLTPVSLAHLNLASFFPKLVVSACTTSLIWFVVLWYHSESFSNDADRIWIFACVHILCLLFNLLGRFLLCPPGAGGPALFLFSSEKGNILWSSSC